MVTSSVEPSTHPGRYLRKEVLGEGGMGVVYRAHDRESGVDIALKTMSRVDADNLLRFKNEFRSLADLAHPNLVGLYDLVHDDSGWFFTMELLEGVAFLDWVQDQSETPTNDGSQTLIRELTTETLLAPIDTEPGDSASDSTDTPVSSAGPRPAVLLVTQPDRLRDALAQLAVGLLAIHGAGKLHRDIKPSNIMVTPEGRLVILDFGVMGDRAQKSRERQVLGTPAYMAPEQAVGRSGTGADWYSVGAVLYETLTNQVPLEGPTEEMLVRRQTEHAPRPSSLVDGVPPDLDDLCHELLHPDPEARLTGAEMLVRLGRGATSSQRVASGAHRIERTTLSGLVGRSHQTDALRTALAATKSGRLQVALVRSSAGMGKSTLIRRATEEMQSAGAVALRGRCHERESLPFKGLDSVLDDLSGHLGRLPNAEVVPLLPPRIAELIRLFPVLSSVPAVLLVPIPEHDAQEPREIRRLAAEQLRVLLSGLCSEQPLCVHIDDFQWSDVDSIRLLETWFEAGDHLPLLLVLSYRDDLPSSAVDEIDTVLERFSTRLDIHPINVGPLSRADALIAAQAGLRGAEEEGKQDPALAEAIATRAGGIPFVIAELTRWELERRELGLETGRLSTVESVLEARLGALPESSRALLEVVAVAGSPVALGVAARAAGVECSAEVIQPLRTGRLVRTRGGSPRDQSEVIHGHIREAIVEALEPGWQRARHGALARSYETEGGVEAARILDHFVAADEPKEARKYVLPAAESAEQSLAFEQAARLYELALELSDPASRTPETESDVRARAAAAYANAGRSVESAALYEAAAVGVDEVLAVEYLRLAAENYLKSGRSEHGLVILDQVLRRVNLDNPSSVPRAVASLLYHRARLRMRRIEPGPPRQVDPATLTRIDVAFSATTGLALLDVVRGAEFAARHLLLALDAGEPIRVCRALALEAANSAAAGSGSRDRIEKLVRVAEELATRADDPHGLALAKVAAGSVRFFSGEWRSALRELSVAEQILKNRCRAVSWELNNTQNWSCNALILTGQLKQASQRIPELVRDAAERGDQHAVLNTIYGTTITNLVADKPERVQQTLDSVDLPEGHYTPGNWACLISQVSLLRYMKRGEQAWTTVEHGWKGLKSSHLLRVQMIASCGTYERALCALSALEQTRAPNKKLLDSARGFARDIAQVNIGHAAPMAASVRAAVAALESRKDVAIEQLAKAVVGFEREDMSYLAACARHRQGELLAGDAGARLVEQSRDFLQAEGVVNIGSVLAMSAPGYGPILASG